MKTLQNVGKTDQKIRLGVSFVSFLFALIFLRGITQIVFLIIGVIAFITGLFRICGIYKLLGINTNK